MTLTGGGTVTMNGTVLYQNVASLTLHNVDNTIQGSGLIGDNGLTLDVTR